MEFYEIDGPFFIYIHDGGNENTIELLTSGLIYELAQELNGAIFTADHRFFRINQARPYIYTKLVFLIPYIYIIIIIL